MATVQDATLLAATIATGLMAGLFFTYANNVMPALRDVDDRAFVAVMQRINVVILNPLFLGMYLGGLVLTGAAVVAVWNAEHRTALPWLLAGVALYAGVLGITSRVNVPLNNELDRAGDVAAIDDVHTVRTRFEQRWNTWNLVRTVLAFSAFACVAAAALVG